MRNLRVWLVTFFVFAAAAAAHADNNSPVDCSKNRSPMPCATSASPAAPSPLAVSALDRL